jgi:pimeloyl-ACP methyl ester carboxylesterase
MLRWVLLPFAALLGGLIAAAWAGLRWITPPRETAALPQGGADREAVEIRSRDGVPLFGLFYPGRQGYGGIVLCHGYWRDLSETHEVGLRLNGEGYNVFMFDFRGCGRSGGRFTTVGYKETWDVLAAVEFMKSRLGGRPLGVLGISMGAAAAVLAAAQTRDIAALALDSLFADLRELVGRRIRDLAPRSWMAPLGWLCVYFGQVLSGGRMQEVRPIDCIAALAPRPILFIYGERDSFIPPDQIQALYATAREPKEMWVAPGSDHAMARLDHSEEYTSRVVSFFRRALSAAASGRPEMLRDDRPAHLSQ